MDKRPEEQSTTVPNGSSPGAKQAEETRGRWPWVEPSVWTKRMLTALEQGVKGGRWFSLYDKVFAERNLNAAFRKVAKKDGAAGVDHQTVGAFEKQLPDILQKLSESLRTERYTHQPIRRTHIPKPGSSEKRPLGIPTVRDRVVQAAVVNAIQPIFERDFAEQSYGFRPGRGCKDALRRVAELLAEGYVHVVDADLQSYFDSIPHDCLMTRVSAKISDSRVLRLIESFLQAEILDGLKQWTPEDGAPQGAVLSPLLSNIYLDPLDHLMVSEGIEMVRYADDFVILCKTAADAARALELVQQWVAENGLTLHPQKTRIVDSRTELFDFLGYSFRDQNHWPRKKSIKKFRDAIRGKTRRTRGRSLQCTIHDVNLTLRGWFGYFKHSTYRTIFREQDAWVRMRLRSILRRFQHRKGRGCCSDHQRWPNAFFVEHGLFSLVAARASAVQSSQR